MYQIYPHRFSENAQPFDFLSKPFKYKHYEAIVRLFVDALMQLIKQQNGLISCLEERLAGENHKQDVKQNSTKNDFQQKRDDSDRKPDYMYFCHDVPLGVIEKKNARYLTTKSIIQIMKQLLVLHKKEQEVRKHNGPLLGILTDALHFIFIKLTADKQFVFEREPMGKIPKGLGPIIGDIKVHTANTWEDLDDIAATINGLWQQIKQERGSVHHQKTTPDGDEQKILHCLYYDLGQRKDELQSLQPNKPEQQELLTLLSQIQSHLEFQLLTENVKTEGAEHPLAAGDDGQLVPEENWSKEDMRAEQVWNYDPQGKSAGHYKYLKGNVRGGHAGLAQGNIRYASTSTLNDNTDTVKQVAAVEQPAPLTTNRTILEFSPGEKVPQMLVFLTNTSNMFQKELKDNQLHKKMHQ